jgi:hypothetical protein
MIKNILLLLLFTVTSFAQKINVADLQLKLASGSTQDILYGFAAGDRIVFSIEEANGKTISDVTVSQYPETVKYKEYEVKKEKNREFIVAENSVFKFSFSNKANEERLCLIKIQRVPACKEPRNFNTAVKWITKQDTTWTSFTKDVVTGYDTLHIQKTRKAVVFEKRYEEAVLDKTQRVGTTATLGESKTVVAFTLPANYMGKDETKKVVAWAYWVGVGEESNEFWKQNRKLIVGAVQGAATMFTSPLGGIAAGAVTNLVLPTNGEDVEYALANEQNKKLFVQGKPYKSFDNGKGIAAYKRFTDTGLLQGKYYVLLANDNYVQSLDVNVKVSAIIEHIKYKDEVYSDRVISPRYEKKIVKEPQIITSKVPVTSTYK